LSLQVLNWLTVEELGRVALLSKSMLALLQEHYLSMREFRLPEPQVKITANIRMGVGLLRFCQQLRSIDIGGIHRSFWRAVDAVVAQAIEQSRRTFQHLESGFLSAALLSALTSCPQLLTFSEHEKQDYMKAVLPGMEAEGEMFVLCA
jgi:hypothetical protein